MADKHNPQIEITALRKELAELDLACAHWDYEDEDPDCEHTTRRYEIKARIRKLRALQD